MSLRIAVELYGGFHDGLTGVVEVSGAEDPPEVLAIEEKPLSSGLHQILKPAATHTAQPAMVRYRRAEKDKNVCVAYEVERIQLTPG
jgi:hypothetical protein